MDKILKQVDDGDKRIITVCAWCCPGKTILDIYPQLHAPHACGSLVISHGICSIHKVQMLQAIQSLPTGGGLGV